MFVMAGSICVKFDTNCQSCGRSIKRCNSFRHNSYCDGDCEERIVEVVGAIQLCNSKKEYFNVKKINVLSGLLKDRKNKFLFVGEGNFSFTVAFNAYRQYLLSEVPAIELSGNNYCWCSITLILIDLLKFSITDKAVESVCKLLKERQQTQSVLKSVSNVVKCLKEAHSESEKANKYLKEFKPGSASINPLDVEHLLRSIRVVNKANEYLLESIRGLEKQEKLLDEETRGVKDVVKQLLDGILKLMEALQKLSDPKFVDRYRYENPCLFVNFDELIKKDIKYRHIISLIVVDEIRAIFPSNDSCLPIATDPPIRIISSNYDKKPYERTIREVRGAMCSGSDGYRHPSDDIVRELRTTNNIHQIWDINFNADPLMYGIDARSIPPEMARWSNLIWFQCPWVYRRSSASPPDLILDFLRSAEKNCASGTFVCVGISTLERFMCQYDLEQILGANLDSCELNQYEFLGVDDMLINELLSYGYKHESKSDHDIHDFIKDHHVTLVFRLKNNIAEVLGELSI